MSELYEQLRAAGETEPGRAARRAVAAQVIGGLVNGDRPDIHNAYMELCNDVVTELNVAGEAALDTLAPGEFSVNDSIGLLMPMPPIRRLPRFLRAIATVPGSPKVIFGGGAGATAVLEVGAAILHPDAQVYAYELHPPAARVAQRVVELFGFGRNGRVVIRAGDVLRDPLPQADLGVTETFRSGLIYEQGTAIAARMASSCREILPAHVRLRASDRGAGGPWQDAAALSLRQHNDRVTGQLLSTGAGRRTVWVHTQFFDARGNGILTEPQDDPITYPRELGALSVSHRGRPIYFSYRLGAISLRNNLELRTI